MKTVNNIKAMRWMLKHPMVTINDTFGYMIRYNDSRNAFEYHEGRSWTTLPQLPMADRNYTLMVTE